MRKNRDDSIHKTSTGKVFQMRDGFSLKPMAWADAKHNYTRQDLAILEVGQSMTFRPMFGNVNPVYSNVIRLR